MGELFGALVATALVLMAVFVPVAFYPGSIGIIYQQFALTIAFSIAISAFNALTFSPMLGPDPSRRSLRGTTRLGMTCGWCDGRPGGEKRHPDRGSSGTAFGTGHGTRRSRDRVSQSGCGPS